MIQQFVFCVYSNTSHNSATGLQPQLMFGERDMLIDAASSELARVGDDFETLAAAKRVGDDDGVLQAARKVSAEERWALTIEQLGRDGRLFEVFDDTAEGRAKFLDAAEAYGLRVQAASLVKRFA